MAKNLTGLIRDPKFQVAFHAYATVFWIIMVPISLLLGWLDSVIYVSALSLWALVASHWAAYQSARAEKSQKERGDD